MKTRKASKKHQTTISMQLNTTSSTVVKTPSLNVWMRFADFADLRSKFGAE